MLSPVALPPDVSPAPVEVLRLIKCGCSSSQPCLTLRCSCNSPSFPVQFSMHVGGVMNVGTIRVTGNENYDDEEEEDDGDITSTNDFVE